MRVAGLFAGIGGIEIAFERAGHQTILLCEINAGASKVLSDHFPSVPIHDDMRTLGSLHNDVDVVCAGFPCQDNGDG